MANMPSDVADWRQWQEYIEKANLQQEAAYKEPTIEQIRGRIIKQLSDAMGGAFTAQKIDATKLPHPMPTDAYATNWQEWMEYAKESEKLAAERAEVAKDAVEEFANEQVDADYDDNYYGVDYDYDDDTAADEPTYDTGLTKSEDEMAAKRKMGALRREYGKIGAPEALDGITRIPPPPHIPGSTWQSGYGQKLIAQPPLPPPPLPLRKGVKVKTPKGEGKVWAIERDVICVVFDNDDKVVYEFEPHEVERVHKPSSKKDELDIETGEPITSAVDAAYNEKVAEYQKLLKTVDNKPIIKLPNYNSGPMKVYPTREDTEAMAGRKAKRLRRMGINAPKEGYLRNDELKKVSIWSGDLNEYKVKTEY